MIFVIPIISIILTKNFVFRCCVYFLGSIMMWGCVIMWSEKYFFGFAIVQVLSYGLFYLLLWPKNKYMESIYQVPLQGVKGKTYWIDNINKGVAVFGASGSGKSVSVIQGLLEHMAKFKYSCIIHDYKDFELTEIAGTIFATAEIPFNVFAAHTPLYSVRVNPIDKRYIHNEIELRSMVKNMFLNLHGDGKNNADPFWRDAAESIIIGMIWRMRQDFQELCNLPFIVCILLQIKALQQGSSMYGNLVEFLSESDEASMKASSFLVAANSEKTASSVYSTLATMLQAFDAPNVLYLLSKDDYCLDITHGEPMALAVVNHDKTAIVQSPINAMIIDIMMNLIDRQSHVTGIVLDEAPRIKLENLESKVSTLRSYGVAFIYAMQDLIQGELQWGGKDMFVRSVTSNLSTQFFGKINEARTGEYYEKFFEFIKTAQFSYSSSRSIFQNGKQSVNKSYKEQRKVRGVEFMRLKQGEFVMFSEGIDTRFRFLHKVIDKYEYKKNITNNCTDDTIKQYSVELMKLARDFIQGAYKDKTTYAAIVQRFNIMNL